MTGSILASAMAAGALAASVIVRAESPDAALAEVRRTAARRIAEIRATPNLSVPSGAKAYYVSGKSGCDDADGLSSNRAWRTIARLNREQTEPGSYVLFERGGLYRGTVAARPGVTYTAFGIGPKPVICGSPEDGANPAKWKRTDNPRVWAYDIGHDDVGTLVFDGGAAHATKIVVRTDAKTGGKFNKFTGRPFNSYRDLDGDLHFWHDSRKDGTGKVYLFSELNPGERFKSVEFNVKAFGFRVGGADGVTIDNVAVRYVGAHGVGAHTCRKLAVRNCEFSWIGGSIHGEGLFRRDYPTRYGNAVEVYGGCDGYVVENCYIWQVYDAGVTHQFNIPKKREKERYDQKNVTYARNVFEKCNYSVEYFLTAPPGNPSRMENVLVEGNLMLDSGYGFCEQRPDRGCAAHIKSWRDPNRNRATNFRIRGNAICIGRDALVQACSALRNPDGTSSLPAFEGNVFIAREGDTFGVVSEKPGKPLEYGARTQKCVDGFGAGNRCLVLPRSPATRADGP